MSLLVHPKMQTEMLNKNQDRHIVSLEFCISSSMSGHGLKWNELTGKLSVLSCRYVAVCITVMVVFFFHMIITVGNVSDAVHCHAK